MTNSLRDALTTAADDPAPPSTVDIDAALSTGHRRRTRRITSLAGVGTFAVAATIVVSATLLDAPGPPRPDIGAQPPTSQFPEPSVDQGYLTCAGPDLGFVDKARTVLKPPAGVWSTPRFGGTPPNCNSALPPGRGFTVFVADQQAVGALGVEFLAQPGYTFAECDPSLSWHDRCQTLPEGHLRPYTGSHSASDKAGEERAYTHSEAVLDTPKGYFRVVSSTCVQGKMATPPPCLTAPPYTDHQLGELAVALARTLT